MSKITHEMHRPHALRRLLVASLLALLGLMAPAWAVTTTTTHYTYDATGSLIKLTKPSGAYFDFTYDAAHRLTDITDALGNRIHYTLDAAGHRTEEEIFDANNQRTYHHSRVYDALSRIAQEIGAHAGEVTSYTYDANGNLLTVTDANTHTTTHSYDALNRRTATTDANAATTHYAYDARDRLVSVTDAQQHQTTYAYDGLDNLLQETSPNTGTTTYAYDSAGNRVSKTDAENVVSTYTYDALNRVTQGDGRLSYYDENGYLGKLTHVAASGGYITYRYLTYDQAGRLTSVTAKGLPHTYDNFIRYRYNADDSISQIAHSKYREINYGYDAAGQVSSVSLHDWDDGGPTDFVFDITTPLASNISHLPFGPIQTFTYGNGKTQTRQYDQNYRETGRSVPDVMTADYGYDPVGNLTGITDPLSPSGSPRTFTYDPLNRLTGASAGNTHAFTYDDVGNRLSSSINAAQTTYTYDLGSQKLLTLTGSQQASYQYDANGDVAHVGNRSFTHTADYLLTAITDTVNGSPVITLSNRYDGFGYRVMKYPNVGGYVTYDHDVLSGTLLNETRWAGVGYGFFAHTYAYLEGEPLARINYDVDTDPTQTPWPVHYYHNDRLGTPQKTTDQTGNLSWAAQIDPFGKATVTSGYITQNLRFPGQYYDEESGLHYNIARFYDPNLGRYLESDPIGLAGGINSYAYVGNNPLNYIDPYGLNPATAAEGAVIGLGIGGPPGAVVGGVIGFGLGAWGTYEFWNWYNNENANDDGQSGEQCPTKGKESKPPFNGPPNGYEEGPRRGREYGPDGKPIRDYDNPHQGADYPHVHEWPNGVREHPGRPYSPIPKK